MNQKGKIKLLVFVGILSFLCLSLIQYYLVSSTYQFKRNEFRNEIKDKAHLAIENVPAIDSIMDSLYYKQYQWMNEYIASRDSIISDFNLPQSEFSEHMSSALFNLKNNFKDSLKQSDANLNRKYASLFSNELKRMEVGYDIKVAVLQRQFIIEDTTGQLDTILNVSANNQYKFVGDDFELQDAIVVTTGRTTGSFTFTDDISKIPDEINGFSTLFNCTFINVDQWEKIVLGQMILTFLLAILSILAVLGLFLWTLRAFIQQKKIADLKTDFINNMTHELKTPLATLAIATKTIQNEHIFTDKNKLTEISQTIDRQNSRLQKLVDQVLTNSIAAADLNLDQKIIPGDTFLQNLIHDFKLGIDPQKVHLQSDFQAKACNLSIDTFYLTTALSNLLENAVKYNPLGVDLKIRSTKTDKHYIIEVADNGIGIDPKNHKNLFEKFYRVYTGNRHDVKGLGLGLYLSKQIIEAHKGSIHLKSALQRGCKFTIQLPLK